MTHDNERPSLTELLDRVDLSHMSKVEIIRLHAEAERAEYISRVFHSAVSKIKAFFTAKKPVIVGSPVRHA